MKSPRPQVPPRVALVLFLVSGALVVWTLRQALAIEPASVPVAHQAPRSGAGPAPAPPVALSRLASAVRNDPFRAERKPPAERFRLPGEPLATGPAKGTVASPFQLIGTAVMTEGGGFAMCRWGDSIPRLVRVGERVGELKLESVSQGRAIFTGADGRRTELRVAKAGT